MSDQQPVTVEATGETVGEAKWAALRELETLVPGLDRDSVRFQVVSEGERGLLGVGFTPAHVIASTDSAATPLGEAAAADSDEARAAQEIVERIAAGIGADVAVSVKEHDGGVTVSCSGPGTAWTPGSDEDASRIATSRIEATGKRSIDTVMAAMAMAIAGVPPRPGRSPSRPPIATPSITAGKTGPPRKEASETA